MKSLLATVVGTSPLWGSASAWAQSGPMMNGGMGGVGWMGGYGGYWLPVLLVVIVGIVVWVVMQKRK